MTDIPQLGPEVYTDDTHDNFEQPSVTVSPMLSPVDAPDSRASFVTHGLDGAAKHRRRSTLVDPVSPMSPRISFRVSPRASTNAPPRLSPHNSTSGRFSFEGAEQQPSGQGPTPTGSGQNSRRGSAVSAENVLEVLDNSAWGESIRRSFTVRRPGDRQGRLGRGGSVT